MEQVKKKGRLRNPRTAPTPAGRVKYRPSEAVRRVLQALPLKEQYAG